MEPVKLKIRERYGQMSRSEKKISQVVLTDSRGCLGLTTAEIAVRSGVSAATVTRYVQKLGYDGLEAFKLALAAASAQEGEDMENVVDPIIQKEDDLDTLCRKMNVLISDTFQDFFYQLDKEALAAAIERIRSARHIYLLGIGASMLPAYDLFHKLRVLVSRQSFIRTPIWWWNFLIMLTNEIWSLRFPTAGRHRKSCMPVRLRYSRRLR